MSLPSIQEMLIVYDRFAFGADFTTVVGASYPACRTALENAFLGVYYTKEW